MEKMSSIEKGDRQAVNACPLFAVLMTVAFYAHAAEPVISRVALSQKLIDLSKNEKAAIEFQLSEQAFVDLDIYDESSQLIFKRAGEKALKKGKRKLEWDGRDQRGEQVSSGVYFYVLEARDAKPYRFDPRDQTGGEEILVQNFSWDIPKTAIHYLLPQASYVRIRIGLKEGVFLGALQDWTALEAGEKEFSWNGQDPSGHFDLSHHPEAQINIAAFSLPDNVVIVKSLARKASLRGGREADEAIQDQRLLRRVSETARNDKHSLYIHARHPRFLCHEPRFQVEFPASKEGPGEIPVRVTLDPRDKDYLTANRFEVMFFVDSVFLFEQEEATSPFTIELDSKRIGAGEHLLTVNVMDYEDHIGVQTIKVKVKKGSTNV